MIADALTKPKVPFHYASIKANHFGVYYLPIKLGPRGCVKLYLPLYVRYCELALCPFLVGSIVDIIN